MLHRWSVRGVARGPFLSVFVFSKHQGHSKYKKYVWQIQMGVFYGVPAQSLQNQEEEEQKEEEEDKKEEEEKGGGGGEKNYKNE